MKRKWQHMATSFHDDDCELEGIKVWSYHWEPTGEKLILKDPIYNQDKKLEVYNIQTEMKNLKFAAGEFSNGCWGFYLDNIITKNKE